MPKFDSRALSALSLAEAIAVRFNHAFVNPDHLLFALVIAEDATVWNLLRSLNPIDLDGFYRTLKQCASEVGPYPVVSMLQYNEQATNALYRAFEETTTEFIGPEHILLGILQVGDCRAAKLLTRHGLADLAALRARVKRMGGQNPSSSPSSTGSTSNSPSSSIDSGNKAITQAKDAKSLSPGSKLIEFGATDLTQLAREGKLDPVIGRDSEIERLMRVLCRRRKNNAALIGDPGVGKTAIAEALAQRIAEGDAPKHLLKKIIVSLDLGSLVAGTTYRGQFEQRMKDLLAEVSAAGNIILFIDEMHTIIGAGSAQGSLDAANLMKAALARGELQCFGATTIAEYRKYFEKDAAMSRRFQPIFIGPTNEPDTLTVLEALRPKYESHHRVFITDEALIAAVKLSNRYLPERFQPDKAIDLIDEAAAAVSVAASSLADEGQALLSQIRQLKHQLAVAAHNQDLVLVRRIRRDLQGARDRLDKLAKPENASGSTAIKARVEAIDVERVVSSWTGVPVERLSTDDAAQVMNLAAVIHQNIIGQDEAVEAVSAAIRRARAGLKDADRPIGSFLFLGPTGVGKTELAKTLAKILFGSEDAMLRLDMSEYMEKFNVSKLIGAPPGYVGYDQPAALTEPIRRRPYSLVLLDEIEKAHPDVWNLLLQILDNGRIADAQGRVVDFRNTVIIMTSNVGARNIVGKMQIGFDQAKNNARPATVAAKATVAMDDSMRQAARSVFSPEFLNRLDEIVVFKQLTRVEIRKIVEIRLAALNEKLAAKDLALTCSDQCKEFLAEKGYDPHYGARPLKRVFMHLIENPLAEEILQSRYTAGDLIEASVQAGVIVFSKALQSDLKRAA